jgi:uncharacterized protein with ParB-like and HNH nuclease domain
MAYKQKSIVELIKKIGASQIILPEIQRAFVWKDKERIERLFDSIYRGYPISVMLFWNATASQLNATGLPFYKLISEYRDDRSSVPSNEKCNTLDSDDAYFVVLDGQQRLTALNIGLQGSVSYHIKNKPWDDGASFAEYTLYFNSAASVSEIVEDKGAKDSDNLFFRFFKKDEPKDDCWISMNRVYTLAITPSVYVDFIRSDAQYTNPEKENITTLKDILNGAENEQHPDPKIQYYEVLGRANYDDVLNIFVRLNSSGVYLTKSELLFSTLVANWVGGRKTITDFLSEQINGPTGTDFSLDWLMRFSLMATGASISMKVESFNSAEAKAIQGAWEKIKSALRGLAKFLKRKGYSRETIKSYNALMPIAYYLYRGGEIGDDKNIEEFAKFFAIAQLKNLFGAASNTALAETRSAIDKIPDPRKTPFTLDIFKSVTLTGNRHFVMEENDLDWLFKQEKNSYTFMALTLLYPSFRFKDAIWHQDHLHPYALFAKKTLGPDKALWDESWLSMRNQLPNLQLLEGEDNTRKNKTPLIDWVNGRSSDKEKHDFTYRTAGVPLDFKDFATFFSKREVLMKEKLREIFGMPAIKP